MKILLVEDHPAVAKASMRVLEKQLGHEAQLAANGADALAFALSMRPDVILMDIRLPDMSGYDLAQQLRGQQDLGQTTLIALSAIDRPEHSQRALEAGFDAVYCKPMDLHLVEKIHQERSRRSHAN